MTSTASAARTLRSSGASARRATSRRASTAGQRCLTNYGWVPVDPADVRKVVLEEPPGGLPLTDPTVQKARANLFGAWEMNWLPYNHAHDVRLPGSTGKPIAFLMYPQGETDEGRKDCLDPTTFGYAITSREVTS